jgi:sugar phosphate isomerase/epimerase
MGERLAHLHLADGSGSTKDEHLVPGRGGQPCAEILEMLVRNEYRGSVVLEISTRGLDRPEREVDLAQALSFARLHLAAAV